MRHIAYHRETGRIHGFGETPEEAMEKAGEAPPFTRSPLTTVAAAEELTAILADGFEIAGWDGWFLRHWDGLAMPSSITEKAAERLAAREVEAQLRKAHGVA